jgi:hypothetical protein
MVIERTLRHRRLLLGLGSRGTRWPAGCAWILRQVGVDAATFIEALVG